MSTLAATPIRPAAPAVAERGRPLVCISAGGRGPARRRKEERLAAVLSEFGFRTDVAEDPADFGLDDRRLGAVTAASLIVCDVVRPDRDLPADLAIAATRGVPVLVLVPEGVPVEGLARELLDDCDATLVRYSRTEPHRALHARLLDERHAA